MPQGMGVRVSPRPQMNNQTIRDLTKEVLEEGFVMSLATIDDGGPWVSNVIYVYDDRFNIYWISLPDARHSKAIHKNSMVACTITSSWENDKEKGLQIAGHAKEVKDKMFEFERKLQKKRGMSQPKSEGEVLKDEYVWYKLVPSKVELIYNELFGYNKKSLNIN